MGATIHQELGLLAQRIERLEAIQEAAWAVIRAMEREPYDYTTWLFSLGVLSRVLKE